MPDDPEQRAWVDCSDANPEFIKLARPCLLSFLAFDRDRVPRIAGTGFLIAVDPKFGLAITAKHVLTEGVARHQYPDRTHADSTLFLPANRHLPTISDRQARAIWMNDTSSDVLRILSVNFNHTLDIATCVVVPQTPELGSFQPVAVPLDTTIPVVGDRVHLVSLGSQAVTEDSAPVSGDGHGHTITIHRRVVLRAGVVTGVYMKGFRQYSWPCFTTSIPAAPGMSGGFLYRLTREGTIGACGIICADNSASNSLQSYREPGESVAALAWTALGLRVPRTIPYDQSEALPTLHGMMRDGLFPTALGGVEHIVAEISGDDAVSLQIRL